MDFPVRYVKVYQRVTNTEHTSHLRIIRVMDAGSKKCFKQATSTWCTESLRIKQWWICLFPPCNFFRAVKQMGLENQTWHQFICSSSGHQTWQWLLFVLTEVQHLTKVTGSRSVVMLLTKPRSWHKTAQKTVCVHMGCKILTNPIIVFLLTCICCTLLAA